MTRATPSAFQRFTRGEERPISIEVMVARRHRRDAVYRDLRAALDVVGEALPQRHRQAFLRLEEALNDREESHHAAYFDVGFELGQAEGRCEVPLSTRERAALDSLRELLLPMSLTPNERTRVALKLAFATTEKETET